jgi:hypothetical protein
MEYFTLVSLSQRLEMRNNLCSDLAAEFGWLASTSTNLHRHLARQLRCCAADSGDGAYWGDEITDHIHRAYLAPEHPDNEDSGRPCRAVTIPVVAHTSSLMAEYLPA